MNVLQAMDVAVEKRALSDFARVNPPTEIPNDLLSTSLVSFIPMADVSESGEWINRQARAFSDVRVGFTSFRDDDVLVAKITPCLENGKGAHAIGLVNGIGFGSTEFHVLRARASANSRFLFHVTQSRRFRSAGEAYMIGSAGQKRVQAEFFSKYAIPALRFAEQSRIAAVLDTLDRAIRQTDTVIEKLKQVKQGLLHDLLTRGIDENGELRPPQSEAPHLYKQSPLGLIPRDWNTERLGSICASIGDGVHYAVERAEDGVPFLFVSSIRNGEINWGESGFVSKTTYANISKRCRPRAGMILFTAVGSYGHAAYVDNDRDFGFERNVAYLFPKAVRVNSKFLFCQMLSYSVRAQIEKLVIGNAQKVLTLASLKQVLVSLPPVEEQRAVILAFEAIGNRVTEEKRLLAKLAKERQGLADDLICGRVRVTPLLKK